MKPFIEHTLTTLEDIGISVRYPNIHHISLADDGTRTIHLSFVDKIGTSVSIEQNQSMKFMMMFMVLDFHIDSNYPDLEGKSFAQKYKNLPFDNDYDLIIRELYRIAKVIRNTLVHNSSSFKLSDGKLDVSYEYNRKNFVVTMSSAALDYFYTSIVMYTKGDLGKGSYFLGIIRSIYKKLLDGLSDFSDEFPNPLNQPTVGLSIKPFLREIIMNPGYEIEETSIKINVPEKTSPEWQGMDFYIEFEGKEFLIPEEALGSGFIINKADLFNNWRYTFSFPPELATF